MNNDPLNAMPYDLMVGAAQQRAREMAVDISGPCVAVWDYIGFCRVYSTTVQNRHFSVPTLNHQFRNYSRPVHI